jgi:hypothetical protein
VHSLNSDDSDGDGRPYFTLAVREFTELLNGLQAADLTDTDRTALRALFDDLQGLTCRPRSQDHRRKRRGDA